MAAPASQAHRVADRIPVCLQGPFMTVTRVMNGRSKLNYADPQLSTERCRLDVAHFVPHDLLYARPPDGDELARPYEQQGQVSTAIRLTEAVVTMS